MGSWPRIASSPALKCREGGLDKRQGESLSCDYTQGRKGKGVLSPAASTCTHVLSSLWPEAQGDPQGVPRMWWLREEHQQEHSAQWQLPRHLEVHTVAGLLEGWEESGVGDCDRRIHQLFLQQSPWAFPALPTWARWGWALMPQMRSASAPHARPLGPP